MNYKDDAFANRIEQGQRAHVAIQLGIDAALLADFPFQVEQDMQQGAAVSWTIQWDDGAPEGVGTEGAGSILWTTVAAPPDR